MFQLSGFYYRLLLLTGSGTVALQVPKGDYHLFEGL